MPHPAFRLTKCRCTILPRSTNKSRQRFEELKVVEKKMEARQKIIRVPQFSRPLREVGPLSPPEPKGCQEGADHRPTTGSHPTAKYGKFRFVCSADPNPYPTKNALSTRNPK